jgi:phasin family protein
MNTRAKEAMSKGTKAIEELVEFSKGNLEAMTASGRVAAKGAEEIAKYSAEYGRATIERANATAKQFAAVKSPTEFFQLQGDVAKQTLDALVAEGSKFTENYLKLLGEIAQPLSNRYAVAAEKVKSTVAA